MLHRRAGLAALTSLVLALSPLAPARADTTHPTLAERQAARNRVTVAQRAVTNLQAKAELAVEFYNGQLLLARQAAAASEASAARAVQAQEAYLRSVAAAEAAQHDADQATAQAVTAEAARTAAQTHADASQAKLDAMAAGAFRGESRLAMVSQLFLASDPSELANGRQLVDRVSEYQNQIIVTLNLARDEAIQSSQRAKQAQAKAVKAAGRATRALAAADHAKARASASNHQAALAAQSAHRALDAAHRAKLRAGALVARAELSLHRAVRSAASLERAAAAARAAAARVSTGHIPSNAAKLAISAAFHEIGVPYSWGGGDESGPTRGFAQGANTVGFDCSGLTLYAYAKSGVHLDHYTGSQWNQGKRISSRRDLLPGDLMFFATDTSSPATIHHVAIYIGKNRMIEAPFTGEVVRVASANRDDFIGGTRPWA